MKEFYLKSKEELEKISSLLFDDVGENRWFEKNGTRLTEDMMKIKSIIEPKIFFYKGRRKYKYQNMYFEDWMLQSADTSEEIE